MNTVRIYFNRKNAKNGNIWSVDQGTMETEVNVSEIRSVISLISKYIKKEEKEHLGPIAWLEGEGKVEVVVEDGRKVAIIW